MRAFEQTGYEGPGQVSYVTVPPPPPFFLEECLWLYHFPLVEVSGASVTILFCRGKESSCLTLGFRCTEDSGAPYTKGQNLGLYAHLDYSEYRILFHLFI